MIYLFKLDDLKEFRDFNMFKALEMIGDDIGLYKLCEDMEDLEKFIIREYEEISSDYYEEIDTNSYLILVDLVEETLIKKIYTLRLESKDASESIIQDLFDEEVNARAKREAELAALNEKISKK